MYGDKKDTKKPKQSLERITELKESGSRLQTILQSYSNKNSMVLAQKLKHTSMEQDGKLRDKPHTYGHLIYDKGGKNL